MKLTYWTTNHERTNSHFITLDANQPLFLGADDPSEAEPSKLSARIRWDGCSFIEDDRPTMYHICHLWEERDRWDEAETIGRAFFGGSYNVGGVLEEWITQFFAELELFEGYPLGEFVRRMFVKYRDASMS